MYKSGHRATHLASKSLAEGQKGALLTAVLKMLDPLVLVLPGLIAFHLYQISRKPTWPTRRWSITFCQCQWWVSSARCYWCGDQYLQRLSDSASTFSVWLFTVAH
ncbi:hypothetical protein ACNKHR_13045 [Shigella flexneri]